MKNHHTRRSVPRTLGGVLVALVLLACALQGVLPAGAQEAGCPNEEFRTGPSASLPDCRAYELVTPEELGRTQAITFTTSDAAIPSPDGERFALNTYAPLEPNPSLTGTRAVYSRTAHGWSAKSMTAPETGARELGLSFDGILSPDLSQVAFPLTSVLSKVEKTHVPIAYEAGPVGGPYTVMAESREGRDPIFDLPEKTLIAGANAGTASVPAFSDVLIESQNQQILPPGPERTIAEETLPGAHTESFDLYDWSEGKLRLVNVEGEGTNVKMLNACGDGRLGGTAEVTTGPGTVGAVSADGSKVFFSSCGRLYMRVDGRETVEITAPQGVPLNPSERVGASYNAASVDGSEVVFNTATPLLAGETDNQNKLFIYNTSTRELKLIADNGIAEPVGTGGDEVLISEDGSAVYYASGNSIYRYGTQTGQTRFIAASRGQTSANEASYTTPNGQFLVFSSIGVEVVGPHGLPELQSEPRGAGHSELYRYNATDGSVVCVSCGEGVVPVEGQMEESNVKLGHKDEMPPFVQMSEDGQRVFFQTTARLVPQDTNSAKRNFGSTTENPGMDVYEWEAVGTEEAPGVVCRVANGCTHLLSTGEDVGKATFLGASEDGDDVFFATAGQLVPQADAEFPNIYDVRVDGGFPPPRGEPECSSCQGVGSPPPLFSTPASGTFVGPGNATAPAVATSTVTKTKTKAVECGKGRVKRKSKCVEARAKHGKKVKRASRGARR
jgi:hypothetical protein